MSASLFRFKQFTIHQEKCSFKVGTDGVLLGAWVNTKKCNSVLDVGTGTGLIAVMLAQRSMAKIDAIEIDILSTEQASQNANSSPWSNRINVACSSFQEYSSYSSKKYDLIVSNPPFFINSKKSPDIKKTEARHTSKLTYRDLVENSIKLLNNGGRLAVILPVIESSILLEYAADFKLFPLRKTQVFPNTLKEAKRVLLELGYKPDFCYEDFITIESGVRHSYTREYKKLTEEFYLNF